MAWRVIGKTIRNFVLAVLEYGFKISAFLGAFIAIGSGPSFLGKVIAGCTSIATILTEIPEAWQSAVEAGEVIHGYNTLNRAAFTELHGPSAVDGVMGTLNEAALYFYGINQNFSEAPLSTIGAAVMVFSAFFVAGWMLRIVRQRDEDLFLVRAEKKLWTMLFVDDNEKMEAETKTDERTAKSEEPEKEEAIPELEVEKRWNAGPQQENREEKKDTEDNEESESILRPDEDVTAFVSNGENNSDVKEFEDSAEVTSSKEEQQATDDSPLKLWEQEEEAHQTDEFDLESELKSAMGEDDSSRDDKKNGSLVERKEQAEKRDSDKEVQNRQNGDSKKSSLSEKINKSKKSKKHSLEEFLNKARSSG